MEPQFNKDRTIGLFFSREQKEEPVLSELVQLFRKTESEGTQEDISVLSNEDNDALKLFRKSIRIKSERIKSFSLENALPSGEELLLCS